MQDDYLSTWRRSIEDPDSYWRDQSSLVSWFREPRRILDDSAPPLYRWFPDATLNTCYNALDRHVDAGRGGALALIYDSPVTGSRASYTYAELLAEAEAFAGFLVSVGVSRGDRVVVYMPMVPEAVVAMLGCARIGAIHSVVFGGFAARELAARIDDARPKVVVSASCGVEPSREIPYKPMLDEALAMARHEPAACVVLQRARLEADLLPGRDIDWRDAMDVGRAAPAPCAELASTDPLYILYTSGTTGRPKGIVRDNGGHAVALAWSMENVFDIHEGQTWWAASDIGWVVGHSYIVYGPLLAGATTVLYEGKPVGTPDAGAFWRVVEEYGVEGLFASPSAMRAIKRDDPTGERMRRYDLSSLRHLFLAGERLDPDTYHWAGGLLGIPVVDNWWQTETGWPIAASLRGLAPMPTKPGSPSLPVPGFDVRVLGADGESLDSNVEGSIAIKLPLPPGAMSGIWGDDERYITSYLSAHRGYYATGDGGFFDDDGYLYVMGRTDDVINVAGHRLSTGAMEAIISSHAAVAECAVIGVHDSLKGQVPRGLVVLKSGVDVDADQITAELVTMVREAIGPVASLKQVDIVSGLPKTRSGKILRGTMRDLADGKAAVPPSTIEDPAVLDALSSVLRAEM